MHHFKQLSYSLTYTVEATINYTKPHKVHFPCHLLIQSPLGIQPASRPLLLALRQERFIAHENLGKYLERGLESGLALIMSTRPLANLFSTWVKSAGGKNVRPAAPARRLLGISHFLALKSCSFLLTSSSDWLVMVSFVPISPCNYFASFFTTEGSDKFYLSLLKSLVEICLNMDAKTSDHRKYFFSFFLGQNQLF